MKDFTISPSKLQHIYDLHGRDFGLLGTKNPQQLSRLRDLIAHHLEALETKKREGYYRGQGAVLFLNADTGIVVISDSANRVVAAFKASSAQIGYIDSKGRLN